MLDFLVYNPMKNTHIGQASNYVILKRYHMLICINLNFRVLNTNILQHFVNGGLPNFYVIKKNILINSNIKFQYCSTNYLNSLRELIFI